MKTAAKVFLILGMVFGALLIFPLVIGAIAYGKLDKPEQRDSYIVWGILALIFCSLLGGIFMLVALDESKPQVIDAKAEPKSEEPKKE